LCGVERRVYPLGPISKWNIFGFLFVTPAKFLFVPDLGICGMHGFHPNFGMIGCQVLLSSLMVEFPEHGQTLTGFDIL